MNMFCQIGLNEFQVEVASHTSRYVPDGRCQNIFAKGYDIVKASSFKGIETPVYHAATSVQFPLLESLTTCEELPDLGTGIVDNAKDLIEDMETLLDDSNSFVLPLNFGNILSAEELAEFTGEPDKYMPSDEMWGFSDSDPAGVAYI